MPVRPLLLFSLLGLAAASPTYVNVLGGALERCSASGMALTGFTRNGQCVDANDDAGSHHICIDLSSTTGGNFCDVTQQPNWCAGKMACDGDTSHACNIKNWCVCEWAFARYVDAAGGCDHIQALVCEATNMKAYAHYEGNADRDPGIKRALRCLQTKCGIGGYERSL